jgi:crotonobetainyl-CoA:carnitine CoA-transferase CaiB-like acyl-CoA transferase
VQFGEVQPSLRRGPEMGEHTDEVLGEIGITQDELMNHKVEGVIH